MNEQGEKKVQQIISNVINSSQTVCDINVNYAIYNKLTYVGTKTLRNLCF